MIEPPLKPKDSRQTGRVEAFVLTEPDMTVFEKQGVAAIGSSRSETDKPSAKTVRISNTAPSGAGFAATPRHVTPQGRYGNSYPARLYPVVPVQQPAVAQFHAAGRQPSVAERTMAQPELRDTVRMAVSYSAQQPRGAKGDSLEDNNRICDDLDSALRHIVISEPLLSEEEIITLLNEDRYGSIFVSRRSLRKALVRNDLENGAKRFRAYMAG